MHSAWKSALVVVAALLVVGTAAIKIPDEFPKGDVLTTYTDYELDLPRTYDGDYYYQNHAYSCWANCFLNLINWRNKALGYGEDHVTQWAGKSFWDKYAARYLDQCAGGRYFASNVGSGRGVGKEVMDRAIQTLGLTAYRASGSRTPLASWTLTSWQQKLRTYGPVLVGCWTEGGNDGAGTGPHLSIVIGIESGKLKMFDPNGGVIRRLSPSELAAEQNKALVETLKLSPPMSFVAAHYPATLEKPAAQCGDPPILEACDCRHKNIGSYLGEGSGEKCRDWDNSGSAWCFVDIVCNEAGTRWGPNHEYKKKSCSPSAAAPASPPASESTTRPTKRVPTTTSTQKLRSNSPVTTTHKTRTRYTQWGDDPCDCRSKSLFKYRPRGGERCRDWDNSGYKWCYVNSVFKCKKGKFSFFSFKRHMKCE